MRFVETFCYLPPETERFFFFQDWIFLTTRNFCSAFCLLSPAAPVFKNNFIIFSQTQYLRGDTQATKKLFILIKIKRFLWTVVPALLLITDILELHKFQGVPQFFNNFYSNWELLVLIWLSQVDQLHFRTQHY